MKNGSVLGWRRFFVSLPSPVTAVRKTWTKHKTMFPNILFVSYFKSIDIG